jgi:phytoene synthase
MGSIPHKHQREEQRVSTPHHHDVAVQPLHHLHHHVASESLALNATDLLANLPHPQLVPSGHGPIDLASAYQICQQITRQHSKSFFFSSQLLPSTKRKAVRALYAFCRTSDDTVDLPQGDPALALATWVTRARSPRPPSDDPVLVAWNDTRRNYAIPQALADELLAGVAMDLSIQRYASFDQLWLYCYRVASVVGLMAMQIVGYREGAAEYAVKLGVALQLTNILRDIGEDARRGRIYLPQEDLRRFGLCDDDILAERRDTRFVALMRYQIKRAQQLYAEAWPGIALLDADSRLAIAAAAGVYRTILQKIERNNYDVFNQRAYVPLAEKIHILWQLQRGKAS